MTGESTYVKEVVERIIEIKRQDEETVRTYNKFWTKAMIYAILISVGFVFIVMLEMSDSGLWMISYMWGVVFEISATVIMLFTDLTSKQRSSHQLSNGTFPKGAIFQKIVYHIASVTPLFLCLHFRFHFSFVTSILLIPAALIVLLVMGLIYGTKNPCYSSGEKMSVSDVYILKQDLSLAGIDINKVPTAALTPGAKDMTIADWVNLKRDLELAGVDISKK